MSSPPEPRRPLDLQESGDELKATLAARREIGPEMEDVLIKNFLQQIERQIDTHIKNFLQQIERQIDTHIDSRLAGNNQDRAVRQKQTTSLISSILGIAIPLVVLAGVFGGTSAIIAVRGVILIIGLAALFRS